jgi:hypothetical protein
MTGSGRASESAPESPPESTTAADTALNTPATRELLPEVRLRAAGETLAFLPDGFGERGTALAVEPGSQKAIAPARKTSDFRLIRVNIRAQLRLIESGRKYPSRNDYTGGRF